ncbi:MAG: chromosome segregation protein SMC [Nitrospirae bacterium]|nr:chromosome segregation protein SMC [Nitrospirota bacterium]
MRVEKIELIGFKSFSEKTVFNFHHGITAIIGPNGCGKSNIVDAVKWVLGEQSAKSLRGASMEDVIFNGSVSKKQKGMAEVTFVISGISSGSSGNGEVSVTRRLYRSGESEYLINKVPCRLKDIKDLFLDTGLELKTYSILEQGRMDEIITSKPLDRRFLIEEVAGVMKYKVRKAEALQKLESSQTNLQRLQDIITEVKRQINSIDRYAKKAERYKRLFEEIKDIEIRIAARDTNLLSKELSDITSSENSLKSHEAELSANMHSAEALIEQKKLVCLENEKKLAEIQSKLYSAEREVTEGEGKAALLRSECDNLKGRLHRLFSRDSELAIETENISTQNKEAEDTSMKLSYEISSLEEILRTRSSSFQDSENEILGLEQILESGRKQLFDKAESIIALKNEISNLTALIEDLNRKEDKNTGDINSAKEKIFLLGTSIREINNSCLNLDSEFKNRTETKERLISDIDRKKEELAKIEEQLYKDREELAFLTSRLESLTELYRDKREGVEENIKILCQVADIFESPPEYETAIEAALGEKLSAAVVDNHHEIKKALDFIKEHKINRTAFIPVNINFHGAVQQASAATENQEGVIGRAVDFVKAKEGFEKIVASLLNNVLIVNNLNAVFDLWQSSHQVHPLNGTAKLFVTLDGDVLEPSGIAVGGIEKGILKVKREIKQLKKTITSKKSDISSYEGKVASFKEDIASIDKNISSIIEEISRIEKDRHELQLKIVSLQEENLTQEKKLEYLVIELDEYRKERDTALQVLNEKNTACKAQEDERSAIEDRIRNAHSAITDKKEILEALRTELTETKLSIAALREKIDSLGREKERLNTSLSEIKKKKEEISGERLEIEQRIGQKEDEIKEKEDLLRSSVVTIGEMQAELSNVKDMLEAKTAELNLIEKQQKSYASGLELVRRELSQAELKKTEASLRLKYITEDIKKSYGIELAVSEQPTAEPSLSENEERLPALREKLQEIGPVNLGTLEEFEELKTRYEFLTRQQDDLIQSISSLQDAISKINRTTHKRLTEAFEALNAKFKEVFAVLFGKGRAELTLTSNNILEAGIEIVAQPPGKKLQNLMLLSGGEKALTALSLLFAGFMIKPTPLCLLDEVDAPLDESNTDRFVALLTELAKNIQFITITHNRRTMEAAEYIYGITMEEPGVSKVISVHMAEAV